MESYLVLLYLTLEQEEAVQALFSQRGWIYRKKDVPVGILSLFFEDSAIDNALDSNDRSLEPQLINFTQDSNSHLERNGDNSTSHLDRNGDNPFTPTVGNKSLSSNSQISSNGQNFRLLGGRTFDPEFNLDQERSSCTCSSNTDTDPVDATEPSSKETSLKTSTMPDTVTEGDEESGNKSVALPARVEPDLHASDNPSEDFNTHNLHSDNVEKTVSEEDKEKEECNKDLDSKMWEVVYKNVQDLKERKKEDGTVAKHETASSDESQKLVPVLQNKSTGVKKDSKIRFRISKKGNARSNEGAKKKIKLISEDKIDDSKSSEPSRDSLGKGQVIPAPAAIKKTKKKYHPDRTCQDCGQTFTDESALKRHRRGGKCATTALKCGVCGKTYRSYQRNLLETHERQHTGELPYKCDQCDKRFAAPDYLRKHVYRKHTPEATSYICDICEMQFNKKEFLLRHKSNMHSGDSSKSYQCDLCGSCFRYKGSLTQHKNSVHVEERLFQCDTCHKTFKSNHCLKLHQVCHSTDSKDVCTICGQTFKRKSSFHEHMRRHNNQRKHPCDSCEKWFYSLRELENHTRVHTGEKPYKCTECSYCCAIQGNLTKHMKVHNKDHVKRRKNKSPPPVPPQPQQIEITFQTFSWDQLGILQGTLQGIQGAIQF